MKYYRVGNTDLNKGNVKAMSFEEFEKAYGGIFKKRNLQDIYKACGGKIKKKDE